MLARIKIAERPLKVENTAPIPSEHRDKRGIPHEKIAVEGGIDEIRHKSAVCVGFAQIPECDFPCGLIAFDHVVMSRPNGERKLFFDFLRAVDSDISFVAYVAGRIDLLQRETFFLAQKIQLVDGKFCKLLKRILRIFIDEFLNQLRPSERDFVRIGEGLQLRIR